MILEPNDEPYVFHSPVFRVASMELDGYAAFIPQSERVIEHGVHHIITVPSGKCHRGCEPPRFDDSRRRRILAPCCACMHVATSVYTSVCSPTVVVSICFCSRHHCPTHGHSDANSDCVTVATAAVQDKCVWRGTMARRESSAPTWCRGRSWGHPAPYSRSRQRPLLSAWFPTARLLLSMVPLYPLVALALALAVVALAVVVLRVLRVVVPRDLLVPALHPRRLHRLPTPRHDATSSSLRTSGWRRVPWTVMTVGRRRYDTCPTVVARVEAVTRRHGRCAAQSDKKIMHGSIAIITVEDGEVAIVRNVGKRQALGPGRYKLESPQQVRRGLSGGCASRGAMVLVVCAFAAICCLCVAAAVIFIVVALLW